jgi:hypothetical protein
MDVVGAGKVRKKNGRRRRSRTGFGSKTRNGEGSRGSVDGRKAVMSRSSNQGIMGLGTCRVRVVSKCQLKIIRKYSILLSLFESFVIES